MDDTYDVVGLYFTGASQEGDFCYDLISCVDGDILYQLEKICRGNLQCYQSKNTRFIREVFDWNSKRVGITIDKNATMDDMQNFLLNEEYEGRRPIIYLKGKRVSVIGQAEIIANPLWDVLERWTENPRY